LGWLSVRKPSIPWYLPIPLAPDDRDLLFREDLADHRREHGVRRGGELRRFEHDAVAGGDDGDDRHQ
jgi:hypothetical protein